MPCAKHLCSVRASVEVHPRNAVGNAECYRGVGRSFVSLAALEGASPEACWICQALAFDGFLHPGGFAFRDHVI